MDVKRTGFVIAALACTISIASTIGVGMAYAYSIYGTPEAQSQTTTSNFNFDLGTSWGQLMTPFQNFWNNIKTINPNEVSPLNPMNGQPLQMSSSLKASAQSLLGWLKSTSEWLVGLVK